MKHLNIKIYGKVQAVFFRETAKSKAAGLQVTGFARNEPDGSVYIEAEGDKENLDKFLEWCKEGPAKAKVEKLDISEGPMKDFLEFSRDFADY